MTWSKASGKRTSWGNIADKSGIWRDLADKIASWIRPEDVLVTTELVPDPGFDDPSAWDAYNIVEGTATVADSKLTLSGFRGNVTTGMHLSSVGELLTYEFEIESYSGSGLIAIQYGRPSVLWTPVFGTGTISGTFVAENDQKLNIAVAFSASELVISNLSIQLTQPIGETVSSWAGITDKNTPWS